MFCKVDYQGWVKIAHQMTFKYIIRSVKNVLLCYTRTQRV